MSQNEFIGYLNSLHNVSASGANALAESQALSLYFGELYEPFPIVGRLVELLTGDVPYVVVLTGHAGDGKSTVALDVLKQLKGLPPQEPLNTPLLEREDIDGVTIVKDMSELSAKRRQQWLSQAFSQQGSWLIVSNTGPLLHSLADYGEENDLDLDIQSKILEQLDQPLSEDSLGSHSLDVFGKELVILNLTRLDNVSLGAKLLTKLVMHSGWEPCDGCEAKSSCPLQLNRKVLHESGPIAEERVRWIYQRLSAYEHRLTLRQIVAHLAFSLTGGMSCEEAYQIVTASPDEGVELGNAELERILFSEGFFGYRGGKPSQVAEGLHAVALIRRTSFGAPVAVNFERELAFKAGIGWAALPPSLEWLGSRWRKRAAESAGVRWRFGLRRMAFLFGGIAEDKKQSASVFLDSFLQSPSLREYDRWQKDRKLTLSHIELNRLLNSCLRVLLEVFSGFSASQYRSRIDALYLTLRRPDMAVIQPTQLVLETLPFRDFELGFDVHRQVPVLSFDGELAKIELTLPLLDYIRRRDTGELGNSLSPIYQSQLDLFRAELQNAVAGSRRNKDEIQLLRAGIDGEVHLHRFILDQNQNTLEQC